MTNEIMIATHQQALQVKEYQGQRVLTFKDIDMLHQRSKGTAKRNFSENKERFLLGEDYFLLKGQELKDYKNFEGTNFVPSKSNRELIFITKMGYLMLVKSFTDDLAWMIQRQLVKNYFEPVIEMPNLDQLTAVVTQKVLQQLQNEIPIS